MLKYENYALRHVQRFIQSKHFKHTLHTRIPIIYIIDSCMSPNLMLRDKNLIAFV